MNIKAYIIMRECADCGEPFEIRVDWDTDKILTKCFHGGKIRLGLVDSFYSWDENEDGSHKFVRITPLWKCVWYKLVNLKRLIFHQYVDAEYWECGKCLGETEEKWASIEANEANSTNC